MKTLDVASIMLSLEKSEESDITPMKLQKLIYFAHGFHLAFTGKPLIDENFEVWPYGPVNKSVYNKFKSFGKEVITAKVEIDFSGVEDKTKTIILDVFRVYNQYSAERLSNLTHKPGTPWKNNANGNVIANSEIKSYFDAQKDAFVEMLEDLEDEDTISNYENNKASFESVPFEN